MICVLLDNKDEDNSVNIPKDKNYQAFFVSETGSLAYQLECSPKAWKTYVSIPGQVIPKTKKKWYLMLPCLTLIIIR